MWSPYPRRVAGQGNVVKGPVLVDHPLEIEYLPLFRVKLHIYSLEGVFNEICNKVFSTFEVFIVSFGHHVGRRDFE